MTATTWPAPNWPADIPHEISGYEKPLYSVLDESAGSYPDQVYTIFNDAMHRSKTPPIALPIFWPHAASRKEIGWLSSCLICPTIRLYFSVF